MKITVILFALLISSLIITGGNSKANTIINNSDSAKICIVSGETIEGDGVKYKYLDREITFCCEGCVKKFRNGPATYLKEGIKCPVCDEDDAKKELSTEHNGVKYYFCGNGCKKKFESDPVSYLNKYNK